MNADGYEVIRLRGDAPQRLRARLQSLLGVLLEDYAPDGDISAEQVAVSKRLHSMWEWKEILTENVDQFKDVIGGNLLYQQEPYLRIARPGRTEDQVGIHRDTHYGSSAHEWVLWVALTDTLPGAELRILPGSHVAPDEAYPWTQDASADCEQGSDKHWLGFRYAPKRMSAEVEAATVPVPCKVGEAILFNCNAVHGQIVNSSPHTRFSVDIRMVDAGAKIEVKRGIHGNIYVPLGVH